VTDETLKYRLLGWVLRIFVGLVLPLLLTSCSSWDPYAALYASPMASTATPSPPAAVTAATASPTPQPVYHVNSDALEIRTGPSEHAQHLDYLTHGQTVTVYSTAQAKQEYCSTWAAINPGLTRWVCMKFLGDKP
jgi:hypothetical protein